MLCRSSAQELIELDGLVRGRACLVLRGLAPQPEEDIVAQLLLGLVGVQDDIAVAVVELTRSFLGPGDDLEVLNAPDEEAAFLAYQSVVPGWFGCG